MKYKVGDKVRIKSLDWHNKNKDNYDCVYAGNGFGFWKNMTRHCGEIMKITTIKVDPEDSNKGFYFMENSDKKWTDEMIEGLVEEETKVGTALNPIEPKSNANCLTIERVDELVKEENEKKLSDESWRYKNIFDSSQYPQSFECPEGYIFKDENGNVINATKIVLEKKKNEYPKSYEECCKVLNVAVRDFDILYNMLDTTETIYTNNLDRLLNSFRKLLICRDAYWKIAGEEMGLGKPWEPDWNTSEPKYVIACTSNGIEKQWETTYCKGFSFPTKEMRDAFYEVFREEIEICKELL